jgi:hypothetical protein
VENKFRIILLAAIIERYFHKSKRKAISKLWAMIDHVLIHLESFGNAKDADELEKFLAEVSEKDEPGVHTRTKWTMERLRESPTHPNG